MSSPTLLDLVEIEKKLREAKAEREKLLRERVSHLPRGTLAATANQPGHTAFDTAVRSLTSSQLPHDAPRKQAADVWMNGMCVTTLVNARQKKCFFFSVVKIIFMHLETIMHLTKQNC